MIYYLLSFTVTLTNDHQLGLKQNPFIVSQLSKYRSELGLAWSLITVSQDKVKIISLSCIFIWRLWGESLCEII